MHSGQKVGSGTNRGRQLSLSHFRCPGKLLGQFNLIWSRPAEEDDPTLHLEPNFTDFDKNYELPFQMASIGHSLGLFLTDKSVDLG